MLYPLSYERRPTSVDAPLWIAYAGILAGYRFQGAQPPAR